MSNSYILTKNSDKGEDMTNEQSSKSTLNIIFGTSVALSILGIVFLFIASAIARSIFYMFWTLSVVFLLTGFFGVLFIPIIDKLAKDLEECKRGRQE